MERFTTLTSQVVALPIDDINTDQIIPGRFLKVTGKGGLGECLFADWRLLPDGSPDPDFPLNQPEAQGATILLAGSNFGCGSSREHAVWALRDWGVRAVIARSFGDIFHANALQNGLLPVQFERQAHAHLLATVRAAGRAHITVDLTHQTVTMPDGSIVHFPIDAFAKHCLLAGMDPMDYLLSLDDRISAYEAAHAHD